MVRKAFLKTKANDLEFCPFALGTIALLLPMRIEEHDGIEAVVGQPMDSDLIHPDAHGSRDGPRGAAGKEADSRKESPEGERDVWRAQTRILLKTPMSNFW